MRDAAELERSDGDEDEDGEELEWDRLRRLAMAADEAGRPLVEGLLRAAVAGCTPALAEYAGTKAENADMWSA